MTVNYSLQSQCEPPSAPQALYEPPNGPAGYFAANRRPGRNRALGTLGSMIGRHIVADYHKLPGRNRALGTLGGMIGRHIVADYNNAGDSAARNPLDLKFVA